MTGRAPGLPRIALFGHGIVGREALRVLAELEVEIVAVYTHAAASGDWQVSLAEPAEVLSIPCFTDLPLRDSATATALAALQPDLIVSAYCRQILPPELLNCARLGGINLHGSPLPEYRGRAPVNWMVLNGEVEGGAALHVMTSRADRGPLLGVERFPIAEADTAYDVLLKVRLAGATLLRNCLPLFLVGGLKPTPQGRGSTYGRRTPADGRIDWSEPASKIQCLVRAVTRPYPGAFADFGETRVTVWWVAPQTELTLPPGALVQEGGRILVGTGSHALELVDYRVAGTLFDDGDVELPVG